MASHEPPGVVVDLSNVLRDPALDRRGFAAGEAAWSRWTAVMLPSWKRRFPHASQYVLVADQSLARRLSKQDRVQFELERNQGRLIEAPDADPVAIDEAIRRGWYLLSRDGYVDHMATPGATDIRFVSWRVINEGIELFPQQRRMPLSHLMTKKRQEKDDAYLGIDSHPIVKEFRWRCPDANCPEGRVLQPNVRGGQAPSCPVCTSLLVHDGKWRTPVKGLKILLKDSLLHRFYLEEGDTAILGREAADGVMGIPGLTAEAMRVISRRHVQISNNWGEITALDVSTNGCWILLPTGRGRQWGPPMKMNAEEPTVLGRGARIRLSRQPIYLELSGLSIGE